MVGRALQKHIVDAPDDLGLLRIHHQLAVCVSVVAEEPVEWDCNFAVCKAFSLSPCAVLGNAAAFLLRQRAHDRNEQLALAVESPDVFFFKIALDAFFLELSDGRQAVRGVAGKAADALGDDQTNPSGQCVRDYSLEALTALGAGAGDE